MLARLAFPMLGGILALMLFSAVDTLFIGQLGAEHLAAMGFTFPVTFTVTSVAMGMGVGASSVVSRAIGAGLATRVRRYATDSVILAVILVTGFSSVGLVSCGALFRALGADEATISLIRQYMVPWFCGVGLLVIPMVGNAIIRATGDTKTPSLIMIIAGLVNLVLDPLFIFGLGPFPRLELMGAALATIIAWMITFASALWILVRREKLLSFAWEGLQETLYSWKEVLHIAVPASLANMLLPLSTAVVTRLIAVYGYEAVAALGVGLRLEALALIGCFALGTGMAPFAGQNYGAGKYERLNRGVHTGILFALLWGCGAYLVCVAAARPLVGLFNDNPNVLETGVLFMKIVPISLGAYGVLVQLNVTLNAIRKPLRSSLNMLVRLLLFVAPLCWLGRELFGVAGVFWGIALGNIGSAVMAYFLYRRVCPLRNQPAV